MKCGHCKNPHDTVAEVRSCAIAARVLVQDGQRMVQEAIAGPNIATLFPSAVAAPLERYRSAQDLPDGIYKLGQDVYKVLVAVHGSGRKYGKKLVIDPAPSPVGAPDHHWEMAPGILNKIMREGKRMTLEEAKEFGAIYGFCCSCGRTLTNEKSIEAGIGPICAQKFDL